MSKVGFCKYLYLFKDFHFLNTDLAAVHLPFSIKGDVSIQWIYPSLELAPVGPSYPAGKRQVTVCFYNFGLITIYGLKTVKKCFGLHKIQDRRIG